METRCLKCGAVMLTRGGIYGLFWACPKSTKEVPHPTKSVRRVRRYSDYDDSYWDQENTGFDHGGMDGW